MQKTDIDFKWEIRNIFTTDVGKLKSVVDKIEWICIASYVDGEYPISESDPLPIRVVSTSRGVNEIIFDTDAEFTSFSNLTQDQVLSWAYAAIDKDAIEDSLYKELEERYNAQVTISNQVITSAPAAMPWA